MSRVSYLNGQFLPHENCLVHIEDRGFQFADGVYEVTLFKNGKLVDGDAHLERLFRSLCELNIIHNLNKEDLKKIQLELFAKNQVPEGSCYLQVTRGAGKRVPNCPKDLSPTIIATVSAVKKLSDQEFEQGFSIMTHEDIRWKRCDIKTVNLLASSMVNQKAKDSGFNDAIFVRDGIVTEGTFSNAFIVTKDDVLVTKNADELILKGITRGRMIEIAQENGLKVEERALKVEELTSAKEVFLTSSSLILRPVVKVDGKNIGDGKAGRVARMLRDSYNSLHLSAAKATIAKRCHPEAPAEDLVSQTEK